MNPLFVVPLLAYTLAATLWPAQVDGHRRAATLLLWEAVFVIIALVAGTYFARLAKPSLDGLWWGRVALLATGDRKSTRLNSSHSQISYAVFCLKKKK